MFFLTKFAEKHSDIDSPDSNSVTFAMERFTGVESSTHENIYLELLQLLDTSL